MSTLVEVSVKTENSEMDEHLKMVKETKKTIIRMFLLGVFAMFMHSSRQPIWVLYAQQLGASYTSISWILYIGLFWKGIGGLIAVSLSNKYGYVYGMYIILVLNIIAVFLECIATNFIIITIGFLLSQVSVLQISLSCIAWLLPHNIATKYTSCLFACCTIAYILGPATCGILSFYISYRMVFWLNFILSIMTLIYALIFIPINIQKTIETKQLKLIEFYMNDDNQRQPETQKSEWQTIQMTSSERSNIQTTNTSNIETTDTSYESSNIETTNTSNMQTTDTSNIETTDTSNTQDTLENDQQKQHLVKDDDNNDDNDKFPICLTQSHEIDLKSILNIKLSCYEWSMLILSLFSSVTIPVIDSIFGIYYCLYVIDKFENGNVMIGSIQLFLLGILGIIGNVLSPHLVKKKFTNKYLLLLLTSIILFCMILFVYPNSKDLNMWYLWTSIIGVIFGFNLMTSKILVLEFQPSSHAGYVNGVSNLLSNILKGVGLLIVGLYWTKHHNIMFYAIAFIMAINIVICLIMLIIQRLHKWK